MAEGEALIGRVHETARPYVQAEAPEGAAAEVDWDVAVTGEEGV